MDWRRILAYVTGTAHPSLLTVPFLRPARRAARAAGRRVSIAMKLFAPPSAGPARTGRDLDQCRAPSGYPCVGFAVAERRLFARR